MPEIVEFDSNPPLPPQTSVELHALAAPGMRAWPQGLCGVPLILLVPAAQPEEPPLVDAGDAPANFR
jgi:hypothetical protein